VWASRWAAGWCRHPVPTAPAQVTSGSAITREATRAPPSPAGNATETEVKGFYQFLADWEKQHLEALRTLYNSVRQDFFSTGSFSPF